MAKISNFFEKEIIKMVGTFLTQRRVYKESREGETQNVGEYGEKTPFWVESQRNNTTRGVGGKDRLYTTVSFSRTRAKY